MTRPAPRRRRPAPQKGRALLVAIVVGLALAAGVVWLRRKPLVPEPAPTPVPARSGEFSSAPSLSSGAPADAGEDAAVPDAAPPPYLELDGGSLEERNRVLLTNMQAAFGLRPAQMTALAAVFAGSEYIGQGNPKASRHPFGRAECLERRARAARLVPGEPRCGAPHMVPLYNPGTGETADAARVCIDQYEFPNLPCEYPLVWTRANEAQALCKALDKRLCDAHEWEGACAGALLPPETEYPFDARRIMMAYLHNKAREVVWAYGKEKNHALCATGSQKSPRCFAGGWNACGTNDYPAGSFPECVSRFGVYDQHGNAAEHMNFPRKLEELGSRGGSGETEMKGSWFIFRTAEAHEDDCRFRAPDWHVTKLEDPNSHRNYHLGFRCCRDLSSGAR